MKHLVLTMALACCSLAPIGGTALAADWAAVAAALGKEGTEQPSGIYRVGLPRTDLSVSVDGVAIKPSLALGGWLAFQPVGTEDAMVMGDLVLTETEILPVMQELTGAGIAVTALHNHVLRAEPPTMYMHVSGHGNAVTLARSLGAGIGASAIPMESGPASEPPPLDLDVAAIDAAMGAEGKNNGGVLQYSIPRSETIQEGMEVPPGLGLGIAINFQPTGGGRAAITGDYVLLPEEVDPVMKALLASGIEITALHSHMLDEEPRLFFMHFWANDDATRLAAGLRAGLDLTNHE